MLVKSALEGTRAVLPLTMTGVVSARRGIGAGDGNRTHVRCPALLVGSITYERRRFCV